MGDVVCGGSPKSSFMLGITDVRIWPAGHEISSKAQIKVHIL